MSERLYFRQLLAGRDFARGDGAARQMRNFVYLIGDRETRECVVVDPAWDVRDLTRLVEEDEMNLVGALATHYHADHIGGDLMGMTVVQGVTELVEALPLKVHCQKAEKEWIRRTTELSESDLEEHESGDVLRVGEIEVRFIHTPGHTPGSQCFLVDGNRLVSGDTLFLDGCGRTDFPGGDRDEMYRSLHERLAHLPDDTILFPGHLYSAEGQASLGETRAHNYVFQVRSLEDWRRFMG